MLTLGTPTSEKNRPESAGAEPTRPDAAQSAAELMEVVTFRVGDQEYCVDIMVVREIRGWSPPTSLPHAPPYVLGLMNLRGTVVPLLDVSARLELGPSSPDARHVVIIAMVSDQVVGFLVSAVSRVLSVPRSAIQPAPELAARANGPSPAGLIATPEGLLRLIDLGALLPPLSQREQT